MQPTIELDPVARDLSGYFQDRLRKLGAWLDAASARSVIVLQRHDGFAVRYYRQDIAGVFLQRTFTDAEVHGLQRGDLQVRRRLVRRIRRRLEGMAAEPGGYQDIFRALGYLLDSERASDLRLAEDEEHDALILARRVPADIGSPSTDERITSLEHEQRDALRKAAQARRGREGS